VEAQLSLEHHIPTAPERAAYSVGEFCMAHRISRSKLYQMWAAGSGPRVMRIGSKVLVTVEAAADWRAAREAASAEPA
jgi:hypothetical protein